jgi:hypothetical protein
VEDLLAIAFVIAIAAVIIVAFLIALYIWALRRAREASLSQGIEPEGDVDEGRAHQFP